MSVRKSIGIQTQLPNSGISPATSLTSIVNKKLTNLRLLDDDNGRVANQIASAVVEQDGKQFCLRVTLRPNDNAKEAAELLEKVLHGLASENVPFARNAKVAIAS